MDTLTLEDYQAKMSLFPSFKRPQYIGEDIEFAFMRFRIPIPWIKEHIRDGGKWPGYEEDENEGIWPNQPWMGDMVWLPVYVGVEFMEKDEYFYFYKCKVPHVFLKSKYGFVYLFPNARLQQFDEIPDPNPDQIVAADKAFEKVKKNLAPDTDQLIEVILECENENCDRGAESEFYQSEEKAYSALVGRYCGKCGHTGMKLKKLGPVWPEHRF